MKEEAPVHLSTSRRLGRQNTKNAHLGLKKLDPLWTLGGNTVIFDTILHHHNGTSIHLNQEDSPSRVYVDEHKGLPFDGFASLG